MGNSSRRNDSSQARHRRHRSRGHHEEEPSSSRRHGRNAYSNQPSGFDAGSSEDQVPRSHTTSSRHAPFETDPVYYQQLGPQYPSRAADNYSLDARAPTEAEYSQDSYSYAVPDLGQNVAYQTPSGSSGRARSPSITFVDVGSAIWSDSFGVPTRHSERDLRETEARTDYFAQQTLYSVPHVFPHSPRDVESAEEEGRDRAFETVHTFDQDFGGYFPGEEDREEGHSHRLFVPNP
ncbi:hypothetical protein S7711_10911 [Stachybotrys chartarum IBT 7711]|uniref:Uncharacterized protein n=1 Tax=Stachybotrys chartarum (strain CBS 109288 / IBT 7711) TaxID=1280523 RepID=A0A084B6G4_STACB|nr:hypothetical protein S7711_10911 [Stachybotrys chartarum IBT 7711]